MAKVFLGVLVVSVLGLVRTAYAQQCQTRFLPFDTEQLGEVEATDCRFRPQCDECGSPYGEYWEFELAAGEAMSVTWRLLTLRHIHFLIVDAAGRVLGNTYFTAPATGRYRLAVLNLVSSAFGTYTVRMQRLTTPLEPHLNVLVTHGNTVELVLFDPPSAGPVLESIIEVGRTPGATDVGVFSMGTSHRVFLQRVPPGTYFVRVRARNAIGWGRASPEQVVTTTPATLPGPRFLSARISGRDVLLIWYPEPVESPILYYEVLAGSSQGGTEFGIQSVGPGTPYGISLTACLRAMPPGVYFLRVRAMTTAGPTESSDEVVAIMMPSGVGDDHETARAAVSDRPVISHQFAGVVGNEVTVQWSTVSTTPVLEHVIEFGSAPGLANLGAVSVGTLTRAVAGVPRGTFYLRVRSRNAAGWSEPSSDSMVTTTGLPGGPRGLRASPRIRNQRDLSVGWFAPQTSGPHVVSYELLVGSTSNATDVGVFDVGLPRESSPGEMSVYFDAVPPGTYYIRVRAITYSGPSETSGEVVATIF